MKMNFDFDPIIIDTLVGGLSALDTKILKIQSLEQAQDFCRAYGYDLNDADEVRKLWGYHRRAVTFIRTELMTQEDEFPEILSDPSQLKDLAYLLIYASTQDDRSNSLQHWACATLRVMHVLAHLDNDLFTTYSSEIQDQVLRPIQSYVHKDPASGIYLGWPSDVERIALHKFDVKAFKTSNSSVLKLLAKPDALAFSILDKVGVRFITKHLFDTFRVLRFLVEKNLISYPHVISDQSNNTLFPANLFLEVMESLTQDSKVEPGQVDQLLNKKLKSSMDRAEYKNKLNLFSSNDYRFIKFISRRLIKVDNLRFFYPFEVQVVDYQTHLANLSGASSHEEYKSRQKSRARLRVLGAK